MKKWMICAVVCLAGACARQAEPGAPLQFAPAGSSPPAKELAPVPQAEPADEDEVELDEEAPVEARDGKSEALDDAPSKKDAEEEGAKGMKPSADAPVATPRRVPSTTAAPCDANCTKLCASAKDKTKCAEAYGKGCFDGSAPAAFDCEGFGKKPAEGGDGVEAQDTPTVGF